jgi:hypothetical protein
MLVGDSLASSYAKQLAALGRQRGFALDVVSMSGNDELPGARSWPAVVTAVARRRPDVIVMAHRWSAKLAADPGALKAAIDQLSPHVGRIILVAQPPALPPEASRAGIRQGARPPFREPADFRQKRLASDARLQAVAGGKVEFLPIGQWLVAPDGTVRLVDADGTMLYLNLTHLSERGARYVVRDLDRGIADGIRIRHGAAGGQVAG